MIPKDILHIILEYDGRIKYKMGRYVNIMHAHDMRYRLIVPLLTKKMVIMKTINYVDGRGFYFEFNFDLYTCAGLCYDCNFSYENVFEICYYNFKNRWEQIRTYI
jgi:hypothetical protein